MEKHNHKTRIPLRFLFVFYYCKKYFPRTRLIYKRLTKHRLGLPNTTHMISFIIHSFFILISTVTFLLEKVVITILMATQENFPD